MNGAIRDWAARPHTASMQDNHYAEDRLDNEEQGRYCKRTLRTTERNDPDAKTYVVLRVRLQ